jgi:hypothetical protein
MRRKTMFHHINWRGFDDEQFEVYGRCMECKKVVSADDLMEISYPDPVGNGSNIIMLMCTECYAEGENHAGAPYPESYYPGWE